jgi:hypothetical protein
MAQNPSIPGAPLPHEMSGASLIARLKNTDPRERERAAALLFHLGRRLADTAIASWLKDAPLRDCLRMTAAGPPETVVGIAVEPECFEEIRAAAGMPALADVPPDPDNGQDAKEFELEFPRGVRLDVLTTREPAGAGAIARYLQKFGAGIQQIEIFARDIERATQILREHFDLTPIYPATRAGANGTRVNFFLVPAGPGKKVLIELVEESPRS